MPRLAAFSSARRTCAAAIFEVFIAFSPLSAHRGRLRAAHLLPHVSSYNLSVDSLSSDKPRVDNMEVVNLLCVYELGLWP